MGRPTFFLGILENCQFLSENNKTFTESEDIAGGRDSQSFKKYTFIFNRFMTIRDARDGDAGRPNSSHFERYFEETVELILDQLLFTTPTTVPPALPYTLCSTSKWKSTASTLTWTSKRAYPHPLFHESPSHRQMERRSWSTGRSRRRGRDSEEVQLLIYSTFLLNFEPFVFFRFIFC